MVSRVVPPWSLKPEGKDWYITKQLMLGGLQPDHWATAHDIDDHSFTGQLDVFGLDSDGDTRPPDSILFTTRSAIPIADAVRGAYEEAGVTLPQLGVINTGYGSTINHALYPKNREAEVARLHKELSGMQKIVVVEQFVDHGGGIRKAIELLDEADVPIKGVSFVKGRWYHDIGDVAFNTSDITSSVKPGMKNIGRKAVALARKNKASQ